jgi:hypothetical protein
MAPTPAESQTTTTHRGILTPLTRAAEKVPQSLADEANEKGIDWNLGSWG